MIITKLKLGPMEAITVTRHNLSSQERTYHNLSSQERI
jgi:hypothetical protein